MCTCTQKARKVARDHMFQEWVLHIAMKNKQLAPCRGHWRFVIVQRWWGQRGHVDVTFPHAQLDASEGNMTSK